jgi:F-type H+-transporting ATPase subunit a
MLPFQIISEISRTVALAVRLFGNIMSGSLLVAIIFSILPLFIPVLMQMLGLVIGAIQAYIFAILAMVYIASATSVYEEQEKGKVEKQGTGGNCRLIKSSVSLSKPRYINIKKEATHNG